MEDEAGMGGKGEAGVARGYTPDWQSVEAGEPFEQGGPSRRESVRMVATPFVLLAAGVACIWKSWLVVGVILCVLGVGTVAFQVALGGLFVKYVLRRGANVFRLLAGLMQPGVAHRGATPAVGGAAGGSDDSDDAESREAAVDAAVGFGLTRAAARGGFFCAGMDEGLVAQRRENVLAERAATYAWLQEGPGWERVVTKADDGVELVAHVRACAPDGGRWAVLCHGYAATWDSMLQYARNWAQAGFNLLVPDMRCHGESGGRLIGMGVLDGADVVSWVRWLAAGGAGRPAADRVVLMGHSMGAYSVLNACGRDDLPPCVCAVVADSPFDAAWNSFAHMLDGAGLPVHPTLDIVARHLRHVRGGYDITASDARAGLAYAQAPVLLVHGLLDSTVPPSCTRRIYEACQAAGRPCEALLVPGAGHCQASLVAPKAYWSRVLGFAEACVR